MSVTVHLLGRLRPRLRARIGLTRALTARTVQHLRAHGLLATTYKAASWARRQLENGSKQTGISHPYEDSWSVPFDRARAEPCGAIDANLSVLQEIRLPPGEILAFEVFVATYARSNRNLTIFSLFDAAGQRLYEWRQPSRKLRDNSFLRLPVADSAVLAGMETVYLQIHSPNGDRRHAITCYTTRSGHGRMWIQRGAHRDSPAAVIPSGNKSWGNPPSGEPSDLGSLVYRVHFRNRIRDVLYRWPNPPRPLQNSSAVTATPRGIIGVLAGMAKPPLFGGSDAKSTWHLESLAAAIGALEERKLDLLLLYQVPWSEALREVFMRAAENRVATLFGSDAQALTREYHAFGRALSGTAPDPNVPGDLLRRTLIACDLVLAQEDLVRSLALRERKGVLWDPGARLSSAQIAERARTVYERLHLPRVSIVTILYNKARELPHTLATYAAQTYEGQIELVFVDDCSPDDSVQLVRDFEVELARDIGFDRALSIQIVRNAHNSGNCVSRNIGLTAATGDILVVIDADCMLNRDFIKCHVEAHAFDDCEVVIGRLNIETNGEDPRSVLSRIERERSFVANAVKPRDPEDPTNFLNCLKRNFSIKRDAIPSEGLFDRRFSKYTDPNSGFDWEDVEAGYRLYANGARIKYVAEAISILVTPEHEPDEKKASRSMRNFARLLQEHPDIAQIAPTWASETCHELEDSCLQSGADSSALPKITAPHLPSQFSPVHTSATPASRRLRVLTYKWHVPHQYELWKLPIDVTVATGCGSPMTEHWELGQRPLPRNAAFARIADINTRHFDLAVLHFDENVLAPENTNGVIGLDWGAAFRLFRENIDLPMIAVCHGTPQFHGQYTFDYDKPDLLQPIERERQRMVDYLGDVHVVCNSYQAQAEWGFRRSSVIWHGFDPVEFAPATYERGILSPLGPLMLSRPHYRGYFLYQQVFEGFQDELRPDTLYVPEPHPIYKGNAYAIAKFRRYIDEIRRYSVYFNPTLRSPMPRSRAEPMMCGVSTVSANNHDVSRFIEQGVDGFYSNDPAELRDQLRFLVRNPETARRMGAAARDKAMRVFHIERYLAQWTDLILKIVQ